MSICFTKPKPIMKKIHKLVFVVLLLSVGIQSAYATASAFGSVFVTALNIDSGSDNILYVKVDQPAGIGGCHVDANWNFAISLDAVVNPTGKYMYMQLLAARSTDSPITIFGLNTCPANPTIQGIQRIAY